MRNLFRYPLVLASIHGEKAHVIGTHIEREREYLVIRTVAGYVFEILHPPISMECGLRMHEQMKQIIAEEKSD